MEAKSIISFQSYVNGTGNGSLAMNGTGLQVTPGVEFQRDVGTRPSVEGPDATGKEIVMENKKRARPWKDDRVAVRSSLPALPQPVGLSPTASANSVKRGRGRPKGTGKLQALAALGWLRIEDPLVLLAFGLGGFIAETAGGNFTPHVIIVLTGEDVVGKITSFAQKGPGAICILSATGSVSSVVIRQAGGMLRYEGRFEIITLTGSFILGEMGGTKNRSGMLSVSLAKPDGTVFGGAVAGSIIAACPIQLVVASFKQNIGNELKRKYSDESSAAASNFVDPAVVNVPVYIPKMLVDDEEICTMPMSAPPELVHMEADNVIAENYNFNYNPLQQKTLLLQAPQSMEGKIIPPLTYNTSFPLM
ncbi:hypothetical protein SLEP1_g7479 [Rubroshorea leprosula]|uniref:AT-hook motif nuclear-localized protein n=1 Tax=Rubroshorea leprosula TaxID=152421 RepID=A0AAV5I7K3_9ROSI|nr:hypothetical protein SLEP1_g7479 [Rubroshorea leprosula]